MKILGKIKQKLTQASQPPLRVLFPVFEEKESTEEDYEEPWDCLVSPQTYKSLLLCLKNRESVKVINENRKS